MISRVLDSLVSLPQRLSILTTLILCATPLFLSAVPPMTDVSQHVLVASIVNGYGDATLRFQDHFGVDWTLAPGALSYVVLAALQSAVGPYNDARLYLCLWIVALWSSVWYLARLRGHTQAWMPATAALPLAFSWYVYMGFLPFIATFPLFVLTIAIWTANRSRLLVTTALLWMSWVALFGFHVVGLCAAAFAVGVMSLTRAVKSAAPGKELAWTTLQLAPVPALLGVYLLGDNPPSASVVFTDPLRSGINVVKFTVTSLSSITAVLLLIWLLTLCMVAAISWRHLREHTDIVIAAISLAALAVLMPVSLGALWPAGPRLLPYAILLLVVVLPWDRWSPKLISPAALLLITGLCISTSLHVRALDREFRDFLAGVAAVKPGSRFLPILVEPGAGSRYTDPFWSLGSAYTIHRGGFNPYVFATPYIKTGASPLTYLNPDDRQFAFLYDTQVEGSDYRGVSTYYDYVLLWGEDAAIQDTLAAEMTVLKKQGQGTLFARRDLANAASIDPPRQ